MTELLSLRRFLELERRVHKIELKLGMESRVEPAEEPPRPEPVAAVVTAAREEAVAPFAQSVAFAPAPEAPQPAVPIQAAPVPVAAAKPQAVPPPLPPRSSTPPVVLYATPPKKVERKNEQGALETMIGLNWTGWVGAIVLVIGAALGIKYGYEQGWFQGMPKEVRLGFCFSIGLALLGVGEWVDRRVNRISAAGVFAAGIATLFVVSYAGFGYFELYAQPTAFVLMAISTLVGSAIALRKNLVVIGTLSLIGGNIAPLILHTDHPRTGALLGYILALQVVALLLANLGKGGKWWILRGFAIAMPALWTLAAYGDASSRMLTLWYSIAYAALVQGELIFAANRVESLRRGLIAPASIITTGLLALSLLYGLQDYEKWHRGLAMLALAAACYAPGVIYRTSRAELSLAYRVQAALLLLVAVPVGLSGGAIVLAWAGLSLAYVIVGNRLNSDIGRGFGVVSWCLAGAYVVYDLDSTRLWLDLPQYLYEAVALTLVGHGLSHLLASSQPRAAITVDVLASGVFLVAVIAAVESWYATGAIVAYAWAMFIAGRLLRRESWELHGGALLLAALVKWASVDMLATRLAPSAMASKYLPVVNPIMAVGTAIAASVVGMYAMTRQLLEDRLHASAGTVAISVATLIIAILTFGLSIEILSVADQTSGPGAAWPEFTLRHLGWTMLWTAMLAIHAGLVVKLVPTGSDRRRWLSFTTWTMGLIGLKFLVIDALLGSVQWGRFFPAPVANLQTLACLVVISGLTLVWWLRDREGLRWGLGGALAVAIGLVVGTIEIARTVEYLDRRGAITSGFFATQMAISIYWAVFAVAAIVAGFRLRLAGLRYFGLALLAVALLKVAGFDLREIGQGYRILSFIGLGGLLLATSVVYGKLSPILLKPEVKTA